MLTVCFLIAGILRVIAAGGVYLCVAVETEWKFLFYYQQVCQISPVQLSPE